MTKKVKPFTNWRTRHIDLPLGAKIIELRETRGVTRKQLAHQLAISLGQMQHFEEGDSRLSAAQLWQICSILDLKVSELFAGLPTRVVRKRDDLVATESQRSGVEEEGTSWVGSVQIRSDVLALSKIAGRLSPRQVESFTEILRAVKPKP